MEFSIGHLIVLLAIVLIIFGPNRLEGLGSSLGKAVRGFKEGMENGDSDSKTKKSDKNEAPPSSPSL